MTALRRAIEAETAARERYERLDTFAARGRWIEARKVRRRLEREK